MLTPYRALLATPGALRFTAFGYLARLGGAMFGVSIIVMIATRRGSYSLAGIISSIGLVGVASLGPTVGRLIDRHGQRRVAVPLALMSAAALLSLVLATYLGAPVWVLVLANLGNAIMPQAGTLIRARWAHLLRGEAGMLHTANSFEQVLDESCFMMGPALGAALATLFFPEAGMLLALLLYTTGVIGLALQRRTEPPVQPQHEHHTGRAWQAPGLLLLAATLALTGTIFGAADVIVVAFAAEHQSAAWGGATLGCFALGSLVGGLVYGTRPAADAIAQRLLWSTLAMSVLLLPVLVVDQLPVLAAVLLVAGSAIAPTLITAMMLAQRLVPESQINEGMTIVMTGLLIGIALGSSAAGGMIDAYGASRAFLVPVLAAFLAFALALLGRSTLVSAERRAMDLFGSFATKP